MADKYWDSGCSQHVIERAAHEYLLHHGATVTAHQHQVSMALFNSAFQMIHRTMFAQDVIGFDFVNIQLPADIILRIRFYPCAIPRGENKQFCFPDFSQIRGDKQGFLCAVRSVICQ